jgi:origin recognition complex subunit 4
MFHDQQSPLYQLVESIYYTTKDVRQFNNQIIFAAMHANPLLNSDDICKHQNVQRNSDIECFINSLSQLEVALLICVARAEIKLDLSKTGVNFNLAYQEYYELAKQVKQERVSIMTGLSDTGSVAGYKIWSKQVARSAWERLEMIDLIFTTADTASGGRSSASLASSLSSHDELKMVKVDVGLLELGNMLGRNHLLYNWTHI